MIFRIDLKIILFLIFFYFTHQIKIYFIFFISITIHECSHLIFGLIFKRKIKKITLIPIGFSIELETNYCEKSRLQELKNLIIEIAGPISNIAIIIVALLLKNFSENLIYANFCIAIFNLLPIYPLDGGRILNSVIILITNKKKYINILCRISYITMILISIAIILFAYYFKNYKIIFTLFYLWYIFIIEQKKLKFKIKIQKMLKYL